MKFISGIHTRPLIFQVQREHPCTPSCPEPSASCFRSKPGGNTIYEFDDVGVYCYYYAHLDRYAERLHEGMRVERGDVIGFVGSTGNADPSSPHRHFAIFELGPEKQWWKGTALNPYPALLAAVKRAK
jgi:hypothetical protein